MPAAASRHPDRTRAFHGNDNYLRHRPPFGRSTLKSVYAALFQDHFLHPRGQGDLPDATHRGEATDGACADWMALALKVEGGRVVAARYRVQGCPGSIAVGSALVSLLAGREARADAVGDGELERALGEIPRMKRHALRLARAALAAALAPARGGAG
jgi:NifU-like protein involved in Fe-S cluster formation